MYILYSDTHIYICIYVYYSILYICNSSEGLGVGENLHEPLFRDHALAVRVDGAEDPLQLPDVLRLQPQLILGSEHAPKALSRRDQSRSCDDQLFRVVLRRLEGVLPEKRRPKTVDKYSGRKTALITRITAKTTTVMYNLSRGLQDLYL